MSSSGNMPSSTASSAWDLGSHLHDIADCIAIEFEGEQYDISYRELFTLAIQRSRIYQAAAMKPGAGVIIDCQEPFSTIIELWALWLAGYCAVPLNTHWTVRQRQSFAEKISAELCTSLQKDFVPGLKQIAGLRRDFHNRTPNSNASSIASGLPRKIELEWGAAATVIATSGSSGTPKAAQHSVANHYYSASGANSNIRLRPGDASLLNLPLFHVGGLALLWRSLLSGSAVLLPSETVARQRRFPPTRATHISMVPTQLFRLLRRGWQPHIPQLRAVLLGGAPAAASLILSAVKNSIPLHTSYGLTELNSQVCTTACGADVEMLMGSGSLLPYRQLALARDSSIMLRGETLFMGYRREDNTLDPAVNSDGWFDSGDLGVLSSKGNLHVLGRRDNMFICGGENIQPETIENELLQIDGIIQAVVIGKQDLEYGQRPFAFVESEDPPDVALLQARLRERLPGLWVPVGFADLPLDTFGLKPRRADLKSLLP